MIDDKLKKIKVPVDMLELWQINSNRFVRLSEKNIAQIKQAFADEGYQKGTVKEYVLPEFLASENSRSFKPQVTMTGQEWYERFENELNNIPDNTEISTTHGADGIPTAKQLALEAAKKASL